MKEQFTYKFTDKGLEEFAKNIRAEALEEAAKMCDSKINTEEDWDNSYWNRAIEHCAAAIRGLK